MFLLEPHIPDRPGCCDVSPTNRTFFVTEPRVTFLTHATMHTGHVHNVTIVMHANAARILFVDVSI